MNCVCLCFLIQIEYLCLFQIYELRVMETKPDKAVSIIECDMNVRPTCCIIETPMNNFTASFKLKCVFS